MRSETFLSDARSVRMQVRVYYYVSVSAYTNVGTNALTLSFLAPHTFGKCVRERDKREKRG